jgi:hypothetical protein
MTESIQPDTSGDSGARQGLPIDTTGAIERPSAQRRRTGRWVQVIRWIALFMVISTLLAAVASLMARSGVDVVELQSAVSTLKPYGIGLQAIAIALIGLKWPAIVRWGRRRNIVKAHEFEQVLALRTKVVVFLLAYLLLIPIGPAGVFRAFGLTA